MKTPLSSNDRVRAAYAGQDARRRLSDLPPALYRDVTDFAKSGKAANARTVTQWLASRGVIGTVDSHVALILKHQPDAQAAAAEFAA